MFLCKISLLKTDWIIIWKLESAIFFTSDLDVYRVFENNLVLALVLTRGCFLIIVVVVIWEEPRFHSAHVKATSITRCFLLCLHLFDNPRRLLLLLRQIGTRLSPQLAYKVNKVIRLEVEEVLSSPKKELNFEELEEVEMIVFVWVETIPPRPSA